MEAANKLLGEIPAELEEIKTMQIPDTEELGNKTNAAIDKINEFQRDVSGKLDTISGSCGCLPGGAAGALKELKGKAIQEVVDATDFGPVEEAATYIMNIATGIKVVE